jgi:hypothetical protein
MYDSGSIARARVACHVGVGMSIFYGSIRRKRAYFLGSLVRISIG